MALDYDPAGPIVDALGDGDRVGDPLAIIGIADPLHVPAIGEKPPSHVLGERECRITLYRDVVAVVDPAEITQLQMASERSGLAAHTLHHAAVPAQREDVVIEQGKIRSVKVPPQPIGCDRHAYAGGDPLAERSRRRLDARGQVVFRMTRTLAVELAEAFQIVERDRRRAEPLVLFINRPTPGQAQHTTEERVR